MVDKAVMLELEKTACCVCGSAEADIAATGKDFEYETCGNTFKFVCCRRCGHLYLCPRPKSADFGIIYPSNYYSYNESDWKRPTITTSVWDFLEIRKIRRTMKLVSPAPQLHVFELGCGSGRLLRLFKRCLPENARVSGVEISPAAAKAAAGILGVEIKVGFFEGMNYPAESFDLIMAQQVIEHVPDPPAIIREAFRTLKTGGILILETPDVRGFDRRIFSRRYWGGYHFPRHFNLFSPELLGKLVKECGFREAQSRRLISATFWITTIKNAISQNPSLKRYCGWINIRNPLLLGMSTILELMLQVSGQPSSNMQFIARK